MKKIVIRKIKPQDNSEIKKIIRQALAEYGGDRPGTAYYDKDLNDMFNAYSEKGSAYFVALVDNKLAGGGGIKHLNDYEGNICELQKLYLKKEYRGLGIGKMLMNKCLKFAKQYGYSAVYLETFPNMTEAQALYRKLGFKYLSAPLGDTGHNTCEIYMLKKFED